MNRTDVYRFIDAEKTTYPVRLLCRLLGVGHSAFYQWLRTGRQHAADRERHDEQRVEVTRQAWSEHRGVYGARRLTAELHDRGHRWNRKAVARLMRLAGIEGAHRRRRGKPRRKAAATATAPDLVQRQFTATAPNRLWVADISYLRTWEGFLYLAVVVDAYSRRVVGWAMADHLRTELILDAVGMAIQHRRPARDQLIHHSDRGTQAVHVVRVRPDPALLRRPGLDGLGRGLLRQRHGRDVLRHPQNRTGLHPGLAVTA